MCFIKPRFQCGVFALQKLLRAFGAKTSAELAAEAKEARDAKEAAERKAEKERRMKIVDELLAQ